MPNDKINVGLVVILFIIAVLGDINNLSYCFFVALFLCLLFCTPLERSNIQKIQVKLGIIKAVKSSSCITRKQYLLLYATSGIIGSILNVICVFFSMPSYIMLGIDIIIIAICAVIHCKMQLSPREEEQS